MDDQKINAIIGEVEKTVDELDPVIKEGVTAITVSGKKWYESKTVWVNGLILIAAVAQFIAGKEVIPAGDQAAIITLLNLILRVITKGKITW